MLFNRRWRRPSRLLMTDLDGTLVGDGEAMRVVLSWCRTNRNDVAVVYNTARTWPATQGLLRALLLPWPDAIVSGIGTEIRYGRAQRQDPAWTRRIAPRWDRRAVEEIAAIMGTRLVSQSPEAQGPFKVSFEVADPDVALAFFAALRKAGLWVHGLLTDERWVDVIPFRAGKGAAAAYLRIHYGIRPARMLASGDSENDLGMLARLGPGIAVGNASPSLLSRLNPMVYRARLPAAAGILEGLHFFGWF